MAQNRALEIFSISPHITFQHIKDKDNILADSLSHLQCPGLYERNPTEKPGQECSTMIFDKGETIYKHMPPEDFISPHSDMLPVITDSSNEESVIDKHTFQVGDLYEEDLPKPQIQYTSHQFKCLCNERPFININS